MIGLLKWFELYCLLLFDFRKKWIAFLGIVCLDDDDIWAAACYLISFEPPPHLGDVTITYI